MKLEMKKLESLYEQYNFDFVYINPKDTDNFNWQFIPEEILVDCKTPPNYMGEVKLKDRNIKVYWDKKITPGDVIFKYRTIQKERSVKLSILRSEFN